jgi:protein TonB
MPVALNLSIVKRSMHRAVSQGSSAKPTPPLPSPELVTMSPTTPEKAMAKSLTRTPKIDTRSTVRKMSIPQAMSVPQPVPNTDAILTKLEVRKKIPKRSTPPEKLVTESAADPIAPPVSPKTDKRTTAPLAERGEPITSFHDSPVTIPGPPAKEKVATGTTRQASLRDDGGPPIVEAVPDYAFNPKPVYPKLAIRRNYQGTVILLVEVLADGSTNDVEVFESSGYSVLDRSAVRTVRKWRFKPGTRYGEPTSMKVKVPVVFRLKGQRPG